MNNDKRRKNNTRAGGQGKVSGGSKKGTPLARHHAGTNLTEIKSTIPDRSKLPVLTLGTVSIRRDGTFTDRPILGVNYPDGTFVAGSNFDIEYKWVNGRETALVVQQ